MKYIIVNKESLEIKGSYEAPAKDDSSANRSWLAAEPVCKHLELPQNLEAELVEAVLVDGEITLQHSSAKEDAQIAQAWNTLRYKRDSLLQGTDKFMLSDFPISEGLRSLIETYRSDLRNLPSQVSDPREEVIWPVKPQV